MPQTGLPPSVRVQLHRLVEKYLCFNCKQDFCGECMEAPYHAGFPCDFTAAPNCIYCDCKILPSTKGSTTSPTGAPSPGVRRLREEIAQSGADCSWCVEKLELLQLHERVQHVCDNVECRKKLSQSCTKLLPCGHWCGGCRGELRCPPCMEPGCESNTPSAAGRGRSIMGGDDNCLVCFESLKSSPVVQLQCGHMYHLECVREILRKGYPGPEVSFKYLCCPLCGGSNETARSGNVSQLVSLHMDHPALQTQLEPHLRLRDAVIRKAKLRLKMEGMMRDAAVQPGGPYDGRPADYALSKFLFYKCNMCSEPYFGGLRQCGAQAIQGLEHNPAELICYSCNIKRFNADCAAHGRGMIEWKCRYCCSVASWFCFGSTHMCDTCHTHGVYADRSWKPKPCDPATCPLRVRHPPHGEEFCLGCSMCRIGQAPAAQPRPTAAAAAAHPPGAVAASSATGARGAGAGSQPDHIQQQYAAAHSRATSYGGGSAGGGGGGDIPKPPGVFIGRPSRVNVVAAATGSPMAAGYVSSPATCSPASSYSSSVQPSPATSVANSPTVPRMPPPGHSAVGSMGGGSTQASSAQAAAAARQASRLSQRS